MCLQWCHVRDLLIDNDLPCQTLCPDEIRLAHAADTCPTCRHYRDRFCVLTRERVPLARTCCHWNAEPRRFDYVTLRMGVNIPPELLAVYDARTIREIFERVDTAPDLPPDTPADGLLLDARHLSVPLVYGVCAACWEQALTGQPDMWCALCMEKAP